MNLLKFLLSLYSTTLLRVEAEIFEPQIGPCSDPKLCCRWFSAPSEKWPGGTCSQTSNQDSCRVFGYEAGTCSQAGYEHDCMGAYSMDFWFKSEDCGKCINEDDNAGAPCGAKGVWI